MDREVIANALVTIALKVKQRPALFHALGHRIADNFITYQANGETPLFANNEDSISQTE